MLKVTTTQQQGSHTVWVCDPQARQWAHAYSERVAAFSPNSGPTAVASFLANTPSARRAVFENAKANGSLVQATVNA